MNWEAITSISTALLAVFTLVLTIATIYLAKIALEAKNSWKSELKERKKLDLLRKINTFLIKLQGHLFILQQLRSFESKEQERDYLLVLHDLLGEIPDLQEELNYLSFNKFSNLLASILIKGNNCPIFQKGLVNPVIANNIDIHQRYTDEVKALQANIEGVRQLVTEAKTICDSEIQKFYNN